MVAFSCEEGVRDAVLNAHKGDYLLISYGLVVTIGNNPDNEFYDFKNRYFREKYGVQFESGGCVSTQYDECFKNKTKELLAIRYGDSILEKAKQEAIDGFIKTEIYKKEYKKRVESDSIFSTYRVHEYPKFKGGVKALEDYLGASTNPYQFEWGTEYFITYFVIEKDGKVSNVRIKRPEKGQMITQEVRDKILYLFDKMPNWKPAVYFNQNVRTSESISVVFEP
ncbi:hypothetical protein H7U19_03505 [Hyunsoonleella sp. SJ7]|uniref:TonB C-terminal domain-containing protein n=1 Tax=Hyunsoonleella aquatilis TaxID=2762758 RepID=A0A923HFF1_9FLAO|nr:hypothetical protein [Hyunsoonleella aquatilis]MBC3757457.1 hypothetical protein [Hyunsoonleella aquatilis]